MTSSSARGDSESFDELEFAIDAFLAGARPEQLGAFAGLPELDELETARDFELGDFEFVSQLGRGAMGIVYLARQRNALNRAVAVKVMPPLASLEGRDRFRREARATLALDHPGIVKVLAVDVDSARPFIAMECVRGLSLDRILQMLRTQPRRPATTAGVREQVEAALDSDAAAGTHTRAEWPEAYDDWVALIGIQLASALQHAHDRGIVHRDVKPGNVMITADGRAVLLDFGVAALRSGDAMTMTGDFLGTLHYCAPEQARGESTDSRSDLYSLGVTLFELLSLERPHDSASPAELVAKLGHEDARRLGRDVPRNLRHICARALARKKAQRYASASALAQDLRSHLAGEPISIQSRNPFLRASAVLRRHRRLSTTLALAAALALGLELRDSYRAQAAERTGASHLATARVAATELAAQMRDDADWMASALAVNRIDYLVKEQRQSSREAIRERYQHAYAAAQRELELALDRQARSSLARAQLANLYALRLEQELVDCADLLAPERLAQVELDLARYDDGTHAKLLSHAGWVRIECRQPAELRIADAQGELVFAGRRGPARLELNEGSYVAQLHCAGFEPAVLPFFVRRVAADVDAGGRARRNLEVELLEPGALVDGYVFVPAGWTLVEDAPPRWEFVQSFQIQREETSYAQWLAWFESADGARWRQADPPTLPRFANADAHLRRATGSSGYAYVAGSARGDWPLRGLTPMELGDYAESLERPVVGAPKRWFTSVPTASEWIRAARGGDGRRYPFGDQFDSRNCAGYFQRGASFEEPFPYPVGAFARDLSPFGVSGMAGSVAELTGAASINRLGEWIAYGGSYRDRERENMRILSTRSLRNEPQPDVGLRIVRRQLPPWLRSAEPGAVSFRDDFERDGATDFGEGWHALQGLVARGPAESGESSLCRLQSGRLVCAGETGNFCEIGRLSRRIAPGTRFRLRALADLRFQGPDAPPSAGVTVSSSLSGPATPIGLILGSTQVALVSPGRSPQMIDYAGFESGRQNWLELLVLDARIEARAWPRDEPRPGAPLLSAEQVGAPLSPQLLTLLGPTRTGGSLELDEIELGPAE